MKLLRKQVAFLEIFNSAKIKARIKPSLENTAKKFLDDVFRTMGIKAAVVVSYDKENTTIDINIDGEEMGVLIGKRTNLGFSSIPCKPCN